MYSHRPPWICELHLIHQSIYGNRFFTREETQQAFPRLSQDLYDMAFDYKIVPPYPDVDDELLRMSETIPDNTSYLLRTVELGGEQLCTREYKYGSMEETVRDGPLILGMCKVFSQPDLVIPALRAYAETRDIAIPDEARTIEEVATPIFLRDHGPEYQQWDPRTKAHALTRLIVPVQHTYLAHQGVSPSRMGRDEKVTHHGRD